MAGWPMRTVSAWMVLATFVVGLGVPALGAGHGPAEDEALCDPLLSAGGHPTDQFEPVLPPAQADHCAICHWLRAMSGASVAGSAGPRVGLDVVGTGASLSVVAGDATTIIDGPSRAPPVPA